MLHDALLVLRKDLLIERRSKELLFTVIAFGLLATLVFALSFYIDKRSTVAFSPGVIWVVVLFSGTLGLQRLFAPENENDCMSGLLLSPADPRGIYLGKVMVQLVFSGAMELVTVPLIFLFFDLFPLVDPAKALVIVALLLLGTLGIAIVGALFAAMLLSARLREVLLPAVIYPLVTPVLISGVQATRELLAGAAPGDVTGWIALIAAFDLIYLAMALVLFPMMVRE